MALIVLIAHKKLEDALNKKEEINDCVISFCNRHDDF